MKFGHNFNQIAPFSINYSRLVDRIIKKLQLSEKSSQQIAKNISDLEFKNPYVTISRDPGSGGRPIGKMVADLLGFDFYNSALINKIVKSSKLKSRVLKNIDEKGRTYLQDFVYSLLNPDYVSDIKYKKELVKVVLSLGYAGKVVILGRGANFILPSGRGLKVRITAPKKIRIQRAIDYEMRSIEQAKAVINSLEKDRREFIRQYFDKNINDVYGYDLVINTSKYTLEQAAHVIVEAFYQRFPKFRKINFFSSLKGLRK